VEATVAAESLSHLAGQETSHGTPSPSEAGRIADLTVVLVEPSRAQASIVRSYLQQLGVRNIHTSGAGRQALALAREVHAHVLLSAMHLSDMTGLQLAEALYAEPECAGMGFILASSESDSDPSGTLARNPRSVLLPKPFDLRRLAQSLAQATGRAPEELLPK
jgi:two-component system chemotaxis response regulator CheY